MSRQLQRWEERKAGEKSDRDDKGSRSCNCNCNYPTTAATATAWCRVSCRIADKVGAEMQKEAGGRQRERQSDGLSFGGGLLDGTGKGSVLEASRASSGTGKGTGTYGYSI